MSCSVSVFTSRLGLSSRKSFENIESWVKSVKETSDTDPIMVLVGTQKDLDRYVMVNHPEL